MTIRLFINGTEKTHFCGQCLYFRKPKCSFSYKDKPYEIEFHDSPCADGLLASFIAGSNIILSKGDLTITKRINSLPSTATKKELQEKLGLEPQEVENVIIEILQRHDRYKASKPEPTQFSAGDTSPIGIGIYEQIEGNRFAYRDHTTGETTIVNEFKGSFRPYPRVPWPLPQEPAEYESEQSLWSEVRQCIKSHLDLADEAGYDILTAWIFATWILEKWQAVPYLMFYGAFETGKSRALEILSRLSHRGWLGLGLTAANFYRPLETWHLTLFLDEAEFYHQMFDVLAILNASYRKGQLVARQEQQPDGSFETRFYDCYGFKSLAGTRNLALTLASRCITFQMTKASKGRVRILIDETKCTELRSKLLMYRFNKMGEEGEEGEAFQKGIEQFAQQLESGRLAELFYPLHTVAPTHQIKNEILQYALETQKERAEELKLSPEVTVLTAILEAKNTGLMKEGKITIKDISDVINFSLPLNEQWSNRTVSTICKRLGFSRTRLHGGVTAIIWNPKIIERLRKDARYASCFSSIPPENASPPSPSSPDLSSFQ